MFEFLERWRSEAREVETLPDHSWSVKAWEFAIRKGLRSPSDLNRALYCKLSDPPLDDLDAIIVGLNEGIYRIEEEIHKDVEELEKLTNDKTFTDGASKHRKICKELSDTYVAKNADYGDSFGKSLDKRGLVAALTRMDDKMHRLDSIIDGKEAMVTDESLRDTLMDLANYAIMTAMWMDDNEGPSEDDYEIKVKSYSGDKYNLISEDGEWLCALCESDYCYIRDHMKDDLRRYLRAKYPVTDPLYTTLTTNISITHNGYLVINYKYRDKCFDDLNQDSILLNTLRKMYR